MSAMLKLTKKLSTKQFLLAQLIILILSLLFLGYLHYLVNIQTASHESYLKKGKPVTSAPKSLRLELEQPDDNLLVFEPSVVISGKSAPSSNVLIMTESKDLIIKSSAEGDFSTVLELDEGVNNISVAVFDNSGDSRSAERTVYYSKEKL